MSLRAFLLLAAVVVAGCTRLNGAFLDANADTDTSATDAASGTGPTSEDSTALPTQDPTGSATDAESSSGGEACLDLGTDRTNCNPYLAEERCEQGQCRPYGEIGDLSGVGCIRQGPGSLSAGAKCSHSCEGQLGKDACMGRSICDPFSDDPECVLLCGETKETPTCPAEYSCFSHVAGEDSFGICRPGCNPLVNTCRKGRTCIQGDAGFHCVPTTDNTGVGDGCKFLNQCAPGLLCVPDSSSGCSGGDGCCGNPCSVGGDDCAKGEVCKEILDGIGGCVDG